MTHKLKTWKEFFWAIANLEKTFEVRRNDRGFKVGDILLLKEWDNEAEKYTGKIIEVEVTYILNGGQFGIEEGFVVMSINY
jgi:hypothetical protein